MSAAPAERMPHARDLRLPASAEEMKKVFADLARLSQELKGALTTEGLDDFTQDMIDALFACQEQNDLRPLNDFIDAWYRSLLFARKPGFFDAVTEGVEKTEEPTYTLEQLRRRLRV